MGKFENSMTSANATITCRCGEVSLKFPNAVPKFRCGCCCTECLQRVYIGTNGTPPEPLKNLEEPLDLLYVDSQIMKPDEATLIKLSVFMLNTDDAPNINLRADCCGAVLVTENAEFHRPHTVATFNNLGEFLRCDFLELPESRVNVFTKDWPREKTQALIEREVARTGTPSLQVPDPRQPVEEKEFLDGIAALQIEANPIPENSISFAELIADMEMKVVNDFFSEARAMVPS
jgi:hypothetical protein